MNKPEWKRGNPWQRGKDPNLGRTWSPEDWKAKMLPQVLPQLQEAEEDIMETIFVV